MRNEEDLTKMLDAISQSHEHAQVLEKMALRCALALVYYHQGQDTEAGDLIKDVRVLGKHPFELTPYEVSYLEEVVTGAIPE